MDVEVGRRFSIYETDSFTDSVIDSVRETVRDSVMDSVMDASFLESEMEKISSLCEQPEETLKYTNRLLQDIDKQIEVSFEIMGERQSIIRQYIEKQQECEQWRQDRFNRLMKGFTNKLNEAHDLLSNQGSIAPHTCNNFSTQTDSCCTHDRYLSSDCHRQMEVIDEAGYGTDEDVNNSIFQDNDDENDIAKERPDKTSNGEDEVKMPKISAEKYYHIVQDDAMETPDSSQLESTAQDEISHCISRKEEIIPKKLQQNDNGKKWDQTILQLKWLCRSIDTLLDCFNTAVEELQNHHLNTSTTTGTDAKTDGSNFLNECVSHIRRYDDDTEQQIEEVKNAAKDSNECVDMSKLSESRLDLTKWESKLQELYEFQTTAFTQEHDDWLRRQVVRVIDVIKTIMKEQKFVLDLIKETKSFEYNDRSALSSTSTDHQDQEGDNSIKRVRNVQGNGDTDESFTILSNSNSLKDQGVGEDQNHADSQNEDSPSEPDDSVPSVSDSGKKFLEEGHRNILAIFNEIKSRMKKMENRLVDNGTICRKDVSVPSVPTSNENVRQLKDQKDESETATLSHIKQDLQEMEGVTEEMSSKEIEDSGIDLSANSLLRHICEEKQSISTINIREAYKLFKKLADAQKQGNLTPRPLLPEPPDDVVQITPQALEKKKYGMEKVEEEELKKDVTHEEEEDELVQKEEREEEKEVDHVINDVIAERCQMKEIMDSIKDDVSLLNTMLCDEEVDGDEEANEKKTLLIGRIVEMTTMANKISSQFENRNKRLKDFIRTDNQRKKSKHRKISPPGGILPNKFTKLVLRKRAEMLGKMFPMQDTKYLAKRIGCGNRNWKKKIQMHNLTLLLQAAKDGTTTTNNNTSTAFTNGINSLIRSKRFKAMVKEARLLRGCDNLGQKPVTQQQQSMIIMQNISRGIARKVTSDEWANLKTIEYNLNVCNEPINPMLGPTSEFYRRSSKNQGDIEPPERPEGRERLLGDDIEQIGNMSIDEVLNNTIVFEEEYENSLIAISKQLDNLEGDVLVMQSTEDQIMSYTTSPEDIEMWTDGLHKAMDKITKLNDAAVFYTKLNILFETTSAGGMDQEGESQSEMLHTNGTLMAHFQKITNTITGLLKNTYSQTAGTYLKQVMISVEEKINRVGAISDGLIKHGIAKLKDVLGSALITTQPSSGGATTGGAETASIHLLKTGREEWHTVKETIVCDLKVKSEKDEYEEADVLSRNTEDENLDSSKIHEQCFVDSSSTDKLPTNGMSGDHIMKIREDVFEETGNIEKEVGGENEEKKEEEVKDEEEEDEEDEEEDDVVDEAVYELKASQEDINETLRNVVDTYSKTTHDTKITDYLKTRINMFTQGSNSKGCSDTIYENESVDNIETLEEEIRKAEEKQRNDEDVYDEVKERSNAEEDIGYDNKEEQKVGGREQVNEQQINIDCNTVDEHRDIYQNKNKEKDRLLKTIKHLKVEKKEMICNNITTLKNVLAKIVYIEEGKSNLQKENGVLVKKLRDLDETLEHEMEDSRRTMTQTFNKNIDRLMEKISVLTNELIDSEEEKLEVIKEANQLKLDAESSYHDLRQQCSVLAEREHDHKDIVDTLESQVKRLSMHNDQLLQEIQVYREQQEEMTEIRNLQSYEEELKEERLRLDEDYKKITLEKKNFHYACQSRPRGDMMARRNSEGEPRSISFSIFKTTQEERDKLSSKLLELNGSLTQTKLEMRRLKAQVEEQEEQVVIEKNELLKKVEKEYKQRLETLQSRHFDETEQLVMSYNEDNQKWEEEMKKLKKDLQEENQKRLAEQKADHETTLKKLVFDQAAISRSELEEVRQKYEAVCTHKDSMLQQFQSDKIVMQQDHDAEVVKLQNTIRKMWSNLKTMKKHIRASFVHHDGIHHMTRDGGDGAESTQRTAPPAPHQPKQLNLQQQYQQQKQQQQQHQQQKQKQKQQYTLVDGEKSHSESGDRKLWEQILEDAVAGSPIKIKELLTLLKPDHEKNIPETKTNTKVCDKKTPDTTPRKTISNRRYEQYQKKVHEENETLVDILVDMSDDMDIKTSTPRRRGTC